MTWKHLTNCNPEVEIVSIYPHVHCIPSYTWFYLRSNAENKPIFSRYLDMIQLIKYRHELALLHTCGSYIGVVVGKHNMSIMKQECINNAIHAR